jgi:hypothetical protein
MPSKKSKSKRRKAAGKGDEQKQGTLASQMQRLQIAGKQGGDEEEAMLEEAIQLAAAEKQEIEERGRENCTHGFNPSSRSQEQVCKDFRQLFITSFNDYTSHHGEGDDLKCFRKAFEAGDEKYKGWMINVSNLECLKSCFVAEGTKSILDGRSSDARMEAITTKCVDVLIATHKNSDTVDSNKVFELITADEHTLVQFFRKQIPCSCLDEKYEEVRSITKMGRCCYSQCTLPDKMAVRSKMVYCTRCRKVNYCSRECQVAAWPGHKEYCGSC